MRILLWLVLAVAAFMGYQHYHASQQQVETMPILTESHVPNPMLSAESVASAPVQTAIPSQSSFRCDGRQYCSQMSSLAEAQFFLKNCPDTKMDGNHDGEPCEQQFGH